MTVQAVTTLTEPGRNFRGTFKLGDVALRVAAGFTLLFLFLPILVIIVFSFNKPAGKFNYTWQGFTLENWLHPFKYPALAKALRLSLEVAALSTAIALVLGTLVAIALVRQRFRGSKAVDTFMILPLTSPEVVMGASLLTLFLSMGWATGFLTIIIAHVAFEISFIAMTVRARIRGFDWTLEDASLDLGASSDTDVLQGDTAADRAGHRRSGDAVLRVVPRRLHHHLLRQRVDGHLSALRQRRHQSCCATADQRAGDRHPDDQPGPARGRYLYRRKRVDLS